jgi:hypothetical protein
MGQILPNGTVFDGRKPDGTPMFLPEEDAVGFEGKRDHKVAEELQNRSTGTLSEAGEVKRQVGAQAVNSVPGIAKKPGAYEPGGVPRPMYPTEGE